MCTISFLLPELIPDFCLFLVRPLITQKPSSVTVEEGQRVSLLCKASGQPTPIVTRQKPFNKVSKIQAALVDGNLRILNVTKVDSGVYACSAKNLLGEDTAVALVTVTDRLKFTLTPPQKVVVSEFSTVKLNCAARGETEIVWKRTGHNLYRSYVLYLNFPNGTLLLRNISYDGTGSFTCVAKNSQRSIEATSVLEVLPASCSTVKTARGGSPSGNYIIDPDGEEGVTPFSVYCDMRDKGGVGVTVISHDSESRTHVNHISPGCGGRGCYRKDVTYTGVSTAQLATLTRVSQNCEQFIKYECSAGSAFLHFGYGWWVSRDGTRMDYWGGASGYDKMCACGETNSCSSGRVCNCPPNQGWGVDSGLLTDKSALPVSQIRLGDLDNSHEEGYHTLGKLKCYG